MGTESAELRSSPADDDKPLRSAVLEPQDSVSLSSGEDDFNPNAMRDFSRSLRASSSSSETARGHRLSLGWEDDEVIEHTSQEGRVTVADNLERVIDLMDKGADFDAVNLSLSYHQISRRV